jgi:hypothetical protein
MLYSTLLRHPRLAASALAALLVVVGCGGPNMSDNERGARINATPSEGDDGDGEPKAQPEDAAAPVVETDAGTTPEPQADAAPVDAAVPVPAGSFAVGTELETTAALNLREGPGTEFAIIVQIPLATRVKVVKISGADGWVNISYDGKTGYSSKDFLKTVP